MTSLAPSPHFPREQALRRAAQADTAPPPAQSCVRRSSASCLLPVPRTTAPRRRRARSTRISATPRPPSIWTARYVASLPACRVDSKLAPIATLSCRHPCPSRSQTSRSRCALCFLSTRYSSRRLGTAKREIRVLRRRMHKTRSCFRARAFRLAAASDYMGRLEGDALEKKSVAKGRKVE